MITRNGYDWTKRFPWIVEAALRNRTQQFVVDGEAVILGVDGISDFDALHSGKCNDDAQPAGIDLLQSGSGRLAAISRKASLA